MNRVVFCGNCGKENRDVNISMRMMTESDKILFDELQFTCWDCKSHITIRIEDKRFENFTNV